MYKIKQAPEEFYVREITNVKAGDKGRYSYFWLKKTNYTTVRAIGHIAQALHVPAKKIGFAGNKDKFAVTEQLISIESGRDRVERLEFKDIELVFFGYGNKPISLGDLEGNYFEIVVRGFEKMEEKKRIVNYFGPQRFSKNNAEVGKAIVMKDFKHAVELILENDGDSEELMRAHLAEFSNDYVGALRKIPPKISRIYVHAYQSKLWNEIAVGKVCDDNVKVPIIGFGTEVDDDVEKMLKKEDITTRDFIIKQFPTLSSEGTERDLFIEIKDFKVIEKGDDWAKVAFSLPKGSYATVVIGEIFK
ncbi:tRNA pseudouridine(13) synthase TruD [Nanoarchaeota archaeon]